jgi:hypothetical protein
LSYINPQDVDIALLNNAKKDLKKNALEINGTGIIGKYKTRTRAKKIDKFEQEIGLQPTAKADAECYITQAQEQNMLRKKNKHIIKTYFDEVLL